MDSWKNNDLNTPSPNNSQFTDEQMLSFMFNQTQFSQNPIEISPPTFEAPSTKSRRNGKNIVIGDGGEGIRRKPWTKVEDERLAKSWCNASTNPALGNDQSNSSFWGLVWNEYNHELPNGWKIRSPDNMRQHWNDVSKRMFAFQNKMSELEALNQSGSSFDIKYAQAQTMYEQDHNHPWSDEKAWLVLKDQPKWKIWSFDKFVGGSTNATKKLKNIDGESSPSPFSTPSDTQTGEEGDDVQEVSKTTRPMGRKAFKRAMRGEGSKDTNMVKMLKTIHEVEKKKG
ncbi:uncharacterized protein [Henckelia pumila]|uniref:uncharacterized protein n=1 Tax=Henckelia pumila TaxID=405737 RepID=UPI003C6E4190